MLRHWLTQLAIQKTYTERMAIHGHSAMIVFQCQCRRLSEAEEIPTTRTTCASFLLYVFVLLHARASVLQLRLVLVTPTELGCRLRWYELIWYLIGHVDVIDLIVKQLQFSRSFNNSEIFEPKSTQHHVSPYTLPWYTISAAPLPSVLAHFHLNAWRFLDMQTSDLQDSFCIN